jgi:hypothetical protein
MKKILFRITFLIKVLLSNRKKTFPFYPEMSGNKPGAPSGTAGIIGFFNIFVERNNR